MSVTVVVPCHKRSDYLSVVLNSIKQQTFFSYIDAIIVSENSDDVSSKAVCELFPELNITYIQQPIEIPSIDHVYWLVNQSKSEITAMLHDDDWWYPTHLESAIKALKSTSVSAYFSNFVFANNEKMKGAVFHHASIISDFAAEKADTGPICFGLTEVATICYLCTPFHMSTMVAKTECIKLANEKGLKLAKPWYADRIIYPFLATCGDIIFNPQVLCGVRMHANNDAKTVSQNDRYASHLEGSIKIRDLALEKGVDVLAEWQKKKNLFNTMEWAEIVNIYHSYFGSALALDLVFSYKDVPVLGITGKIKKKIKKTLIRLLFS